MGNGSRGCPGVTFSPPVPEKGSRSTHMFPVGNEKVAERERERERKPTYPEVTVAGRTGWTGDPILAIKVRPRAR